MNYALILLLSLSTALVFFLSDSANLKDLSSYFFLPQFSTIYFGKYFFLPTSPTASKRIRQCLRKTCTFPEALSGANYSISGD